MLILIAIWLINSLTLMAVAWLLPGFHIENFYAAMMTALILGLLNGLIRPLLLLLTLPITLVTLGLFTFVVNGLILWLASTIVKGFSVDSFGSAVWAAVLLWIISFISNYISSQSKS